MPRVISGKAGRIRLETLGGLKTRPTADKTKEGMFNILQARTSFVDFDVLELFAGSGQLAIESLSRGAKTAILVDESKATRPVQLQNLTKTNCLDQAEIWTCPAKAALHKLSTAAARFDLILADPPYKDALSFLSRHHLEITDILKPGGYFVFECGSDIDLANIKQIVTDLQLFKHCTYGAAMVVFYMKHNSYMQAE